MVDNISEQQKFLIRTLQENGASLVGFGDVSVVGSEWTRNFPIAISFGVKYDKKIVENLPIDEESFYNHLQGLDVSMKRLVSLVESLLSQWGYEVLSIGV